MLSNKMDTWHGSVPFGIRNLHTQKKTCSESFEKNGLHLVVLLNLLLVALQLVIQIRTMLIIRKG